MLKRLTAVALVVMLAGCQGAATDPPVVTPDLAQTVVVYGPTPDACLAADVTVSDWPSLRAELESGSDGKVIAIEGTITVPSVAALGWGGYIEPVTQGDFGPIAALVVDVTADDIDPPLEFHISVECSGSYCTWNPIEIPFGTGRTITVTGIDDSDAETHRGSQTIDVAVDVQPTFVLTLSPLQGGQPIDVTVFDDARRYPLPMHSAVVPADRSLTCASVGAGLRLEADLALIGSYGSRLSVEGLDIVGVVEPLQDYGSLMLLGPAAVHVSRSSFHGTASEPLSIQHLSGSGSEISYNSFAAGQLGVAVFLVNTPDTHFHDNRVTSQGEMATFGALQIQGVMTRMTISRNHFQIFSSAGYPYGNAAIALRVRSDVPAFATISDNVILGPWGHSLESRGCDIDWTGNRLDGADPLADIWLGPTSCRNYTRTKLARPQEGWGDLGPQFSVIDLGTDNTILGVTSIKHGTETAPPFEELPVFCPPGHWDRATNSCTK